MKSEFVLGQIMNSSYGSSDVCLEAFLLMCNNLQIHSYLPKEITEPQIGIASTWIQKKYDLRWTSVPYPQTWKETVQYIYIYIHISAAVMRCNSFTFDCLRKETLPTELLCVQWQVADCLRKETLPTEFSSCCVYSDMLHKILIRKLCKYI